LWLKQLMAGFPAISFLRREMFFQIMKIEKTVENT